MTRTRILTILGIAALSVVAILGWTRKVESPVQQPLLNPAPEPVNSAYDDGRAPSADVPSYATRPSVRTIAPAAPVANRYEEPYSGSRPTSRRRVVTRERPFSHSAAIVGGSAGAGAAIGALAGGGKGAGIGALSGGAAGLIYDRLTHKRKVVEAQ